MPLTKTLYSTAKTGATQAVSAARQGAANEANLMFEKAKQQLGEVNETPEPDFVNPLPALTQKLRDDAPVLDRAAIEAGEKAAYSALEEQLRALRAKRSQAQSSYSEGQTGQMQPAATDVSSETVAPAGKTNKRNFGFGAAAKKGMSNFFSRRQPEAKQGNKG